MLGARLRYANVPFFWTAQFGRSIRYTGYCYKPDAIIVHGSLAAPAASAAFTLYYVVGDRVAAVVTFNRDPQAVAALELMRLGEMPSPRQLHGVDSFDLTQFLRGTKGAGAISAAGGVGARS
jgi:apoptosis-inducing factor 3